MVYQWSPGKGFMADPQRVGEEIEEIEEPDAYSLIHYAKAHPGSELYKCFVWDDHQAAELYRLNAAREILISLKIVPLGSGEPVKQVLDIKDHRKESRRFSQDLEAERIATFIKCLARAEDLLKSLDLPEKEQIAGHLEIIKALITAKPLDKVV